MEGRRKTLGRRIKRARLGAGYRSQKSFAEAIGVSENSVARAEIGDERVGQSVFLAIEGGLGWTESAISVFLDTGDEATLDRQIDGQASQAAASAPADDERAELERLRQQVALYQMRDRINEELARLDRGEVTDESQREQLVTEVEALLAQLGEAGHEPGEKRAFG
ncbi:helix-turn-helix domain-containing protein [Saccharopolyspora sp. K220]|uniref:helix-turn-helix domain-containing protein n=1 Tax=Saccharopolyspora soli TaxID=2926618 RepID=UPI001F567246|nr:helix-turn-helix transcriptional regulator [Saccharopolyspora soli]MCI2421472.1 helix-turn-helix domain-containing protein [Saccharopolyspora soli]